MEIFARDLKVGDKVNCHEDGWLVVTKIKESFILNIVTFENGKEKYLIYNDDYILNVGNVVFLEGKLTCIKNSYNSCCFCCCRIVVRFGISIY